MDVAALSTSAGKLLEALERLGVSPGAELRGGGPSGLPSRDVIEAFEKALNGEGGAGLNLAGEQPSTPSGTWAGQDGAPFDSPDFALEKMPDGTLRVPATNDMTQAERMPKTPSPAEGAARQTPDVPEQMQEVARLLENVTSGQMRPTELYRLQYLVGMLKVHAATGNKISEKSTQALDSVLKQQG